MTKVSVIVPAYNAEKFIGRCVESILNQEYKDLELIVVNDGSKDNTAKILDEYALKDDRLKVIHKANSGVSNTRNRALDIATGEYVQFLDADDWIPNDSTKMLVRAMEENKVDLVVADFYRVVGDKLAIKGSIISDKPMTKKEYAECMMETPADFYYGVIWNKLYKRSILEQYHLRMDESLSYCEDFIFNLEYILHIDSVFALQVPVYYYVKTEGSLVAQNISISKTIKMKTNVFQYYNEFFKNILDEKEYRNERASITRFLVTPAMDNFVIPLMPGTKKLGEEVVPVYYESDTNTNIIITTYLLNKATDRLLDTIAKQYDMDLKDIKILYGIYLSKDSFRNIRKLSDLYNMPQSSVILALQILMLNGYIEYKLNMESLEISVKTKEKADDVIKDVELALKDLMTIVEKDMDEGLVAQGKLYMLRATENLKNFLTN